MLLMMQHILPRTFGQQYVIHYYHNVSDKDGEHILLLLILGGRSADDNHGLYNTHTEFHILPNASLYFFLISYFQSHNIWNFCPIPLRCCADPAHRSSLCPLSPAPPGPHTSWVPAPESSSLLLLASAQARSVLLLSVCCPFCPRHHFCYLLLHMPAAWQGPAPTEWPPSHGPRRQGYTEVPRREWSGFPVSSDCPGRRQRRRWSCSLSAVRRCQEKSPC